MGITVKLDTKGVEAKLNNAKGEVAKTMLSELNRFGLLMEGDARRLAPIDEGFLAGKIQHIPATLQNLKTDVIVAANYAAYIEFGTRAFGAAYVSSLPPDWQAYAATFKGKGGGSYDDFIIRITEWVKRKGIDQNAAYLIARKILRFGIRPHPFFYPAFRKNFEIMQQRLNQIK